MKRVFFVLWSVLLVAIGFCSCENVIEQSTGNDKNAVVAVVSVNDMHAAIDMMPQFAALLDSLRGVYPELLVF